MKILKTTPWSKPYPFGAPSVIAEQNLWSLTQPSELRRFLGAGFWEGDATKHFSVKKGVFSEKAGGNSVNEGFGKDFCRKDSLVKRSGPFSELPDSEN